MKKETTVNKMRVAVLLFDYFASNDYRSNGDGIFDAAHELKEKEVFNQADFDYAMILVNKLDTLRSPLSDALTWDEDFDDLSKSEIFSNE